VTTAYIAVDLEMSSKGTSIKDIVHNGEDAEIKKAWKDYIDAQNPDAAIQPQGEYNETVVKETKPELAAGGGRRKTRRSRRRRSRKGKTIRRKKQ
jgi:hypothetical protein